VRGGSTSVSYILTDHLGQPQKLVDAASYDLYHWVMNENKADDPKSCSVPKSDKISDIFLLCCLVD